jgi:molecular chaperone DnaK (HSP70)
MNAGTLAIDFGTCYSSAARLKNGKAEAILAPGDPHEFVPSSAFLTTKGELLVGWPAQRRWKSRPQRFRDEFKRELGKPIRLYMEERDYAPEELAWELLEYLKDGAEKTTGDIFARAVLTYPVSYDEHRRDLMRSIGAEAGFADVQLLQEPVAAVIGYAGSEREASDRTVLVYDLGGGTFDAALVRFEGTSHEVLGFGGIKEGVGGTDFDRAIRRDLIGVGGKVRRPIRTVSST